MCPNYGCDDWAYRTYQVRPSNVKAPNAPLPLFFEFCYFHSSLRYMWTAGSKAPYDTLASLTSKMHSGIQTLDLTFQVRHRHRTKVQVEVTPNISPNKTGCHLILPNEPSAALDFPVCRALLNATDDVGYAATYGWLQTVLETPLPFDPPSQAAWDIDPIPITEQLSYPFCWFGPEAQLFDAPFRTEKRDVDWTCHSFLAYIPDALVSKKVCPVLGFEWGFKISDGQVSIKRLRLLDIGEAWEGQRGLWAERFPGWTFEGVDEGVSVQGV